MTVKLYVALNNAPEPTIELDYMPTVLPNVGDSYMIGKIKCNVASRAFHYDVGLWEIYLYCEA